MVFADWLKTVKIIKYMDRSNDELIRIFYSNHKYCVPLNDLMVYGVYMYLSLQMGQIPSFPPSPAADTRTLNHGHKERCTAMVLSGDIMYTHLMQ